MPKGTVSESDILLFWRITELLLLNDVGWDRLGFVLTSSHKSLRLSGAKISQKIRNHPATVSFTTERSLTLKCFVNIYHLWRQCAILFAIWITVCRCLQNIDAATGICLQIFIKKKKNQVNSSKSLFHKRFIK